MTRLIVYLTFIPWFLYFSSLCKNAIKDLKENKVTMPWIKENLLKIFHFDNLILFAIFIYFSAYYRGASQIWLVNVLLFSAINLYLFMNRYYDKNRSSKEISQGDVPTILIILMISLIPIIFYMTTSKYTITYYIMFGFAFFNYLIVYISKTISKGINKLIKKNNESK